MLNAQLSYKLYDSLKFLVGVIVQKFLQVSLMISFRWWDKLWCGSFCFVEFFPHLSSHLEIKVYYVNNQNIQLITIRKNLILLCSYAIIEHLEWLSLKRAVTFPSLLATAGWYIRGINGIIILKQMLNRMGQ